MGAAGPQRSIRFLIWSLYLSSDFQGIFNLLKTLGSHSALEAELAIINSTIITIVVAALQGGLVSDAPKESTGSLFRWHLVGIHGGC